MTNHSEIATEAARAAPAVTVTGLSLFGVSLSEWVFLLTIVYTLLQMFFLIRDKWYYQRKADDGCKR